MKIAGFSIVRNAIKFDYPIVEAIQSVLPLCDIFYIAVGKSEDETRKLIEDIPTDKIVIIDTVWDENLREGGRVLAEETNKAFNAIPEEYDWCFYIQGDEVLHEGGLNVIRQYTEEWLSDKRVEGFVLDYRHFYGSYDYIGNSRQWYRREVRLIRNDKQIYSFRDAQGFQKNGRPLKVKHIPAFIHHYGWVKHPKFQQQKQLSFNKLWHSDEWVEKNVEKVDEFDYGDVDSLTLFKGTHPEVIIPRLSRMNWTFTFDPTRKKPRLKKRVLMWVEKYTGWRIGEYRNYRII